MSMYSQNHLYPQMPFPGPSYSQVGYQYQHLPPPPPPVYHIDPASFRRDYASRLAELTVNSRPIIQNLSMIAQDYARWAEIVAQCLEAHIRRVPPWMKLPAFYLLDAISKNVYEPYARHFAAFVIPLFLETYNQVDQNTRSKMEEMLLTWRAGSPTGKELFGVVPQVAIERGVWGGESTHGADSSQSANGFYSGSGQINKSMVLSELEFTVGQKERALQANPYDSTSQNHLHVLQQLRKLVEAGVSQEELRQILSQLRALVRSVPPPVPPPPASSSIPQSQTYPLPSTSHTSPYPSQHQYPPFVSSQPQYPQQQPPQFSFEQVKSENLNMPSIAGSFTTPESASTPHSSSAAVGNIANLFNALVKAGVVSASATPTGAGATAKDDDSKPIIDIEKQKLRSYRQLILAQKIKLTGTDITKSRPQVTRLLYDQLAVQCKQCGIRFADDSLGKREMEDHLDMHFRQNRKANQNVGRGHSRSWFIGVEDWISDKADFKGHGDAGNPRRMNAKATAAAEMLKRDAELRALFVVVPPGDEAKHISCPICKETLKSEFLEEDEDWVWKNAIKKDDKVYHATCHAEAVASTNSLAARLRSEIASRSRSGTPEAQLLRSTSPKATSNLKTELRKSPSPLSENIRVGQKRKVDEDSDLNTEADGTPPLKKVALSA